MLGPAGWALGGDDEGPAAFIMLGVLVLAAQLCTGQLAIGFDTLVVTYGTDRRGRVAGLAGDGREVISDTVRADETTQSRHAWWRALAAVTGGNGGRGACDEEGGKGKEELRS